MTHEDSGLVVDAEVRRGGFTLAVNLAAAPGQVLGLLGPNGAGKSTLLSAVAGLTPVSAGRITLAGQVMDDAAAGTFVEASGRPVGFVFQNYRLFPHLTVAQNVAFSPRVRGGGQAARAAASHWMARLGLAGLADRKPAQLSGGQAQRVALARALAGQPALLLLDEPLSALDAGTRLDVQAELKSHLAGFTGPCLLVTHDPIEALVLADQLVVVEGGRIVQQGTPAQIARQPTTSYVAKLVGLNLYQGHADGSQVTLSGGGSLITAGPGQHGDVLVAVRPSAILVSTQHPRPSSARNTWPATITGLTMLADRVRLDLDGRPSALADVTPTAVAELSLDPGSQIWLTVKATDLEVYPPDGSSPYTLPSSPAEVKELLVEAAESACDVGEMHLQDPVARPADRVVTAHEGGVARGDIGLDVVAVDQLVRELADQMAGVRAAQVPAGLAGQLGDVARTAGRR